MINNTLTPVSHFARSVGVTSVTIWRWRKHGLLGNPINIAGRKYFTAAQIAEFTSRAERGEFAIDPVLPTTAKIVC